MRAARIAGYGLVLAVVVYLVWSVDVIIDHRWVLLALGTGAALLSVLGPAVAAVPGLALGIYTGQPLLVAMFALMFVLRIFPLVVPVWAVRPRTKPRVLVAALDSVDPAMVHLLTADAGGGPISSEALVWAAARQRSATWAAPITPPTGAGWDGYLVRDSAGRSWTSIAAEAVVLARILASESAEPPVQLLAAAAVLVPESAAAARFEPGTAAVEAAVEATGLSLQHLAELTVRFGTGPAGPDAMRRADLRLNLDPERTVPNDVLFTATNRRLWILTIANWATGPLAVVLTVGALLGRILLAPVLLPRWIWRRRLRPRTVSAARVPRDQAPRDRSPGRLRLWLRMTAELSSVPASVGLRVVRPACTVAAVTLVAVSSALPLWVRLVTAALILVVRPLRRWWFDVPLFAAVLVAIALGDRLLLAAGAVLLLRATVTALALRESGIDRAVVGPRRALPAALTGDPSAALSTPEETWSRYLKIIQDDDKNFGDSLEYLLAAWAAAEARIFLVALVRSVRAEVFGWTPVVTRPLLMRRMHRLVMVETVVRVIPRYLLAVGVGVGTVLAGGGAAIVAGPVRVPGGWMSAGAAAVLALLVTRPQPWYKSAALVAGAALWVNGLYFMPPLAVVVAGATGAWALREAVTRRTVNAPMRMWWVGWRVTGIRYRRRFRAAAVLASRGRSGIAVDLLDEIVAGCGAGGFSLAAVALAQWALVELDRGNLQRAVERSAQAVERGDRAAIPTARALSAYAHGIVQFAVGAYAAAATALLAAEPVLRRRSEGSTCLSVLAQSSAATGDVPAAMAAAGRAARVLTAPGQLLALVESQLAAGWAQFEASGVPVAKEIVGELLRGFAEPFEAGSPLDDRSRHQWWRLLGQGHLLMGRIHLYEGDVDPAQSSLRQAGQWLRRTVAPELLGMTRIYEGDCRRRQKQWAAARTSVSDGIALLESRRGQLRGSADRASAVRSGLVHYDAALGILADAQCHGDVEAGRVAVTVLESLRRNALAATLRDERSTFVDRLSPDARLAIEEIVGLELALDSAGRDRLAEPEYDDDAQRLRKLRETLAAEVSRGFADAYLPEDVDVTRLLASVGRATVLQFEICAAGEHQWRGYRVWIPPVGAPRVDEVLVTDADALGVLRTVHGDVRDDARQFSVPLGMAAKAWAALCDYLVPADLREELRQRSGEDPARLLVVPGEHLAYLPWASLLLDPDDEESVLVHKAVIQVVPSLAMLRPAPAVPETREILAYLDADAARSTEVNDESATTWRRLTSALPIVRVESRSTFEQALSDRRPGGAFLAAHGTGTGLSQSIHFSEGGALSAAAALKLRWPRWMVFASCLVARVEQQAGQEPFGLVVACMLGGCQSVIGGVIEVERGATEEISAGAALALAASRDPAAALRDAQRRFLADWGSAAFIDQWAGLICISTVANRTA